MMLPALALALSQMQAGGKLNLRDITNGEFRAETMSEVKPMADGETYAQISDDGDAKGLDTAVMGYDDLRNG